MLRKNMLSSFLLITLVLIINACSTSPEANKAVVKGSGATMELTSLAFQNGGAIPAEYSADGADISPALKWEIPPDGTKSFALICDDPDAPMGTWVHWVVFDLPPDILELPKGIPPGPEVAGGGNQGQNDSGNNGYSGPAPPSGTHRYFFKLYALDTILTLPTSTQKKDLEKAMEGHIIASSELMGTYTRK